MQWQGMIRITPVALTLKRGRVINQVGNKPAPVFPSIIGSKQHHPVTCLYGM